MPSPAPVDSLAAFWWLRILLGMLAVDGVHNPKARPNSCMRLSSDIAVGYTLLSFQGLPMLVFVVQRRVRLNEGTRNIPYRLKLSSSFPQKMQLSVAILHSVVALPVSSTHMCTLGLNGQTSSGLAMST